MGEAIIWLVILPLLGAAIALPAGLAPARRVRRALSYAAAAPLVAMAVLVIRLAPDVAAGIAPYALGGWVRPAGIALRLDGLAWLGSLMIVGISIPVALTALDDAAYDVDLYFFLMVLIAGMQIVVLSDDLFTLFVAFEIVAISAYVLIAYERTDAGLLASLKYLFLSSVGILIFLVGVLIVYRTVGTLSLELIGDAIAAGARGDGVAAGAGAPALRIALAALAVGIGVRTAFIPFHTWLPEAHAYAPHPVSALLSGVLIKVSLLALVRLVWVFGGGALWELFVWIGAVTALVAVVWALAQHDAKRLLAYHSISQMGFILAAFGAGGAVAAAAHAVHHALFKSLLFLAMGAAIPVAGGRNLYEMRAIGRLRPLVAAGLVVGSLSIAGIPPFNGFASKGWVGDALYGSPAYRLLQLAAVGTVASFVKVVRVALPGAAAGAAPVDGAPARAAVGAARPAGAGQRTPGRPAIGSGVALVMLSAACLAFGIWAEPLWSVLAPIIAAGIASDGGATVTAPGGVWSPAGLIAAAVTTLLGIAVWRIVVTPRGRAAGHRIAAASPQLDTVLVMFLAGFALFAVFALAG